MKRTTIFPSSLAQSRVVAALAAVVLAGAAWGAGLLAQQAPAAQQPAAAAPARAALPATHVVQQGETLWGLAQQLLGDPLLWPEIYRVNTSVIEDPHWIFPGEELRLVPAPEQVAAAPAGAAGDSTGAAATAPADTAPRGDITVAPQAADTQPTQAPQSQVTNPATGPTIFGLQGRARVSSGSLRLREQRQYRAVREGEYRSAGYVLDAGEQLAGGTLLGNVATSSISRLTTASSALLYGTVSLTVPPRDTLVPGEMLMSYDLPRIVPGYGAIVRPTGLLKTLGRGEPGDTIKAQIVAIYQPVDGGQGVIRAEPYVPRQGVRPVAVAADSGVRGEVIDLRSPREVVNEQGMLFINRGSAEGVHLGDVFDVTRDSPPAAGVGTFSQLQGKVLIVYVRSHTATGLLIEVDRADIRPGSVVHQVLRMPS